MLITSYPLIYGLGVENVAVRDLCLDGNREKQPMGIGACRGAAVYFLRSHDFEVSDVVESGFDLMLTEVGSDYAVTVGTRKGSEALRELGRLRAPTDAEIASLTSIREAASERYRVELSVPRARLPRIDRPFVR